MKKSIVSTTRLLGLAIIAAAIFAAQIGLDNDTEWGLGRFVILLFGFAVLLIPFASDRYQNMQTDTRLTIQTSLVIIMILFIYLWYVSYGRWTDWPRTSNYYDRLASAFQQGQVALLTEPDPALVALPDPYDYEARTENKVAVLWDLSLYKGKYYLYWGPVPALLMAPVKFFFEGEIGDQYVTFTFLAGMLVFYGLLAFIVWRDHFRNLPVWTLLLGLVLTGLCNPILWLLHRAEIYQAAISAGQFFLAGAIFWLYLGIRKDKPSISHVFLGSLFMALAISSRLILILPILFLLIAVTVAFYRGNWLRSKNEWTRFLLALGAPLLIGAICLAWYNLVRFDSIFEFGLKYQLNYLNYLKAHQFFSSSYLPANLYNYFLHPFGIRGAFPFLKALLAEEKAVLGTPIPEAYYPEPVSGILYTSPFFVFALVAVYLSIKKESPKSLKWLAITLAGTTCLAFATFLLYFFGTMRFLADAIPGLALLAVIGFWLGSRHLGENHVHRTAYSILAAMLGVWTMAASLLLGISSTGRRPIYIDPILLDWFKSIIK